MTTYILYILCSVPNIIVKVILSNCNTHSHPSLHAQRVNRKKKKRGHILLFEITAEKENVNLIYYALKIDHIDPP